MKAAARLVPFNFARKLFAEAFLLAFFKASLAGPHTPCCAIVQVDFSSFGSFLKFDAWLSWITSCHAIFWAVSYPGGGSTLTKHSPTVCPHPSSGGAATEGAATLFKHPQSDMSSQPLTSHAHVAWKNPLQWRQVWFACDGSDVSMRPFEQPSTEHKMLVPGPSGSDSELPVSSSEGSSANQSMRSSRRRGL